MFVQNFIELSATVHEISWIRKTKKNSDKHINTFLLYSADSKNTKAKHPVAIHKLKKTMANKTTLDEPTSTTGELELMCTGT